MSFDFNPSLWFVCRLCQNVFPNADKLKNHKLENHLGDCFRIKTIIFEEKFLDYGWTPKNPYQHSSNESVLQNSSKQQQLSQSQDQEYHDPVEKFKNPYVSLPKLTARQIHSALNKKSSGINESNNIGPSEEKTTLDFPSIFHPPKEIEIPFSTHSYSNNADKHVIPLENSALVDAIVPKEEPFDEPTIEVLKHEFPLNLEDGEYILASVETRADGTALVQFQSTELYRIDSSINPTNAIETHFHSYESESQLEEPSTDIFEGEEDFTEHSFVCSDADTIPNEHSVESDSVPLTSESQSEVENSSLYLPTNSGTGERIKKGQTKKPKGKRKNLQLISPKNKKSNPIKKSVTPKKDPVRVLPIPANSEPQAEFETVSEPISYAEIAHENIPQENTKIPKNKRKGVQLISSKINKKRKLGSQPSSKKRKEIENVSLGVDLELDLPLNQWLDKQKEKNPSNLILLDPDPSTVDHFLGVSAENPVRCKLCKKSFEFETNLRFHVIQCWSMNKAKHNYCHLCNKFLCNPGYLKYHNRVNHSAISFDIELGLGLGLPLNQWLDKQKEENPSNLILLDPDPSTVDNFVGVSVENPVKCKLCQESFNSERNLRTHVMCCWMNKEKHRHCHLCNKTVNHPWYLKEVHNRIFHSTEPRTIFKCNMCPKEFLTERGLQKHEVSPKSAKSFSCTICGKLYRHSYTLKYHMLSHSAEKKWKCGYDQSICQATFETKVSLKRHRKTHQKYACPIPECGKTFRRNRNLTVHCKRHEQNSCKTTCGDAPCTHKELSTDYKNN